MIINVSRFRVKIRGRSFIGSNNFENGILVSVLKFQSERQFHNRLIPVEIFNGTQFAFSNMKKGGENCTYLREEPSLLR